MKIIVIAEVDVDTGEYEVTFRNKSSPGMPMELSRIKEAFLKTAQAFAGDHSKTVEPVRN